MAMPFASAPPFPPRNAFGDPRRLQATTNHPPTNHFSIHRATLNAQTKTRTTGNRDVCQHSGL
jgi:hypothetical protein